MGNDIARPIRPQLGTAGEETPTVSAVANSRHSEPSSTLRNRSAVSVAVAWPCDRTPRTPWFATTSSHSRKVGQMDTATSSRSVRRARMPRPPRSLREAEDEVYGG